MNLTYQIEGSKKPVNIELQNGRVAIISSSASFVNEDIKEGKLQSISYEGKLDFKIDDILYFKLGTIQSEFKIKEILKNEVPNKYYFTCGRSTLTNYFILPLIATHKQDCLYFGWDTFLINTYLSKDFSKLIMVVRYFPLDLPLTVQGKSYYFHDLEQRLTGHPNYLGFENPNFYTIVYHFYIDNKYKKDVELFIKGKYSKISESVKKKILEFLHLSKNGELGSVLFKSPLRKQSIEKILGVELEEDIDLYSAPDLNNEIYELIL
jgi:hypothetical protein